MLAGISAAVPVVAGVAVATLCGGCITHRVGPGVLRNFMQPSRDTDPTADFTREQVENPWAEPAPPPSQRSTRTGDRVVSLLTGRAAATIAALLAGAMPALVWSGSFDENRWFGSDPPRRSRISDDRERQDGDSDGDAGPPSPSEANDAIRAWPRP